MHSTQCRKYTMDQWRMCACNNCNSASINISLISSFYQLYLNMLGFDYSLFILMLLICLELGPVFRIKNNFIHIIFISFFLSLQHFSLHFNYFHYFLFFFLSFVYLYLSVAVVVIVVTVLLYIIYIAFLFSRMLD